MTRARTRRTKTDDSVVWLVWEAYQHTRRAIDDAVQAHGVTAAQLGVLNRLAEGGGLTGAEVARRMLTTPQAAHVALTSLERKGLVRRSPDPEHGRLVRSLLTEEGERVVRICRSAIRKVGRDLESSLDADERAHLIELLRTYIRGVRAP